MAYDGVAEDHGSRTQPKAAPAPDVSVHEAARRAGLPTRAIHRAIQSGALRARETPGQSGREYRVAAADLARLACPVVPNGARAAARNSPASRSAAQAPRRVPRLPWADETAARLAWPLVALLAGALALSLIALAMATSRPSGGAPLAATATQTATATPAGLAIAAATRSAIAAQHTATAAVAQRTATAATQHTAMAAAQHTATAAAQRLAGLGHSTARRHVRPTTHRAAARRHARSTTTRRRAAANPPNGATAGSGFILVVAHGRTQITIQAQMTLGSPLNGSLLAALRNPPRSRARRPARPARRVAVLSSPGDATAAAGTVHVTANGALPRRIMENLQRWAIAYGAVLSANDGRDAGLLSADGRVTVGRASLSLWQQLHKQLGAAYTIMRFSAQYHSALAYAAHS